MHRFHIEDSTDYGRYHFRYRPMAELETIEELPEVYAAGFLPASGDPTEPRHLFYLARSLRYDLGAHALDKKRRYDFRQVEELAPRFEVIEKADAGAALPPDWETQAFRWMIERSGNAYLTPERLAYVRGKPYCSHVAVASVEGEPLAYVLLGWKGTVAHYWYAFYDSRRFSRFSLGKWLMARTAQWARSQGLSHLYVGTGYGCQSSYKSKGVAGVEFFDGTRWNPDPAELKRRQDGDPAK